VRVRSVCGDSIALPCGSGLSLPGVRSAEFGAVVTGEPDRREHASFDDESGPWSRNHGATSSARFILISVCILRQCKPGHPLYHSRCVPATREPPQSQDDTLAARRRGLTFSEGPLGEGPDCARRPQPVMKRTLIIGRAKYTTMLAELARDPTSVHVHWTPAS
jgi:hypothetical protein